MDFERASDGGDEVQGLAGAATRQAPRPGPHDLVEELHPPPFGLGAHQRQGAAHGQTVVHANVGELTRPGAGGGAGGVHPQHPLVAGMGPMVEDLALLQQQGRTSAHGGVSVVSVWTSRPSTRV